jgi:hypothetical protein
MAEGWKGRWHREHSDFAVPCVVSGRWLEFGQNGTTRIGAGEVLTLSVMTDGSGDRPRKLCELLVTREDLMQVLSLIEKSSE